MTVGGGGAEACHLADARVARGGRREADGTPTGATVSAIAAGCAAPLEPVRHAEAVAALECQMLVTPRERFPDRRAVAAYRLAMAYAELPAGDMSLNRRRALACFAEASEIFAELGMVVEEARARNGTGSTYRALGQVAAAEQHFEAAFAALERLASTTSAETVAAVAAEVANNLGLVHSETGRFEQADRAFAYAMERFDRSDTAGRRGWASACVNRGLAAATRGDVLGLRAAIGFYQTVLDEVDGSELPYQHAMAWHGLGVVEMAMTTVADGVAGAASGPRCPTAMSSAGATSTPSSAQARPGEVDEVGCLARAERAFGEARKRFSPQAFPYQYASSCHNLAEVHRRRGDLLSLRRAVACLEDALAALDPRWYSELRQVVSASMAATERQLAMAGAPLSRAEHFVRLLAACDEVERRWWLRERIGRLLALPDGARDDALGTLAEALCRLDLKAFGIVLQAELQVLMEWPVPLQAAALRAQLFAHLRLEPDQAHRADAVLDESITSALNAPQRVMVRDYLRTFGYERP